MRRRTFFAALTAFFAPVAPAVASARRLRLEPGLYMLEQPIRIGGGAPRIVVTNCRFICSKAA